MVHSVFYHPSKTKPHIFISYAYLLINQILDKRYKMAYTYINDLSKLNLMVDYVFRYQKNYY